MQNIRAAIAEFKSGALTRSELLTAVCKNITAKIDATRASVWLFNEAQDEIRCISLYDARDGSIARDAVLTEKEFAPYFEALRRDGKVVAVDAQNHPATSCFNEKYFRPNDIRSLLDHVVIDVHRLSAILCCENCSKIKAWTEEDMNYLLLVSAQISFALE